MKRLSILLVMILILVSLSAASAADLNQTESLSFVDDDNLQAVGDSNVLSGESKNVTLTSDVSSDSDDISTEKSMDFALGGENHKLGSSNDDVLSDAKSNVSMEVTYSNGHFMDYGEKQLVKFNFTDDEGNGIRIDESNPLRYTIETYHNIIAEGTLTTTDGTAEILVDYLLEPGYCEVVLNWTGDDNHNKFYDSAPFLVLGTFTHLQKLIDEKFEWESLRLPYPVAYNEKYDGDNFTEGILINKNITILDDYSIDARGHNRIFKVDNNATLTLRGTTLTNGSATRGGAIYVCNNSRLEVHNDTFFISNRASYGGAIYIDLYDDETPDDIIILDNITFANNTALKIGGAVYCEGILNLTNSTFESNTALEDAGAIYCTGLNAEDVNITNNTATSGRGGALFINFRGMPVNKNQGLMNLINVVFAGNTVKKIDDYYYESEMGYGGAIYISAKGFDTSSYKTPKITLNNTNVTFINNSAYKGGAIFMDYNGFLILNIEGENTTFVNNKAHDTGGAIYYGGVLDLEQCLFENNTADIDAGAIRCAGIDLYDSEFNNNFAKTNGGAIWIDFTGMTTYESILKDFMLWDDTIFTNNTAEFGGAVFITAIELNADLGLAETEFIDNTAFSEGGAIYAQEGEIRFMDGIFENNTAKNGGAISNHADLIVSGGEYFENTAKIGGAIYNNAHLNVNKQGEYYENTADAGGAIYNNGDLIISEATFEDNTAENGGAIYVESGEVGISDGMFKNNTAKIGGAIYNNADLFVNGTTFIENKADSYELTVDSQKNILNITLRGNENYFNAIYSESEIKYENVTYWNGNLVRGVDDNTKDNESGQNITIEIYDMENNYKTTVSKLTSDSGFLLLDFSDILDNGEYRFKAYHPDDSYYTYIETEGQLTVESKVSVDVNLTVSVENIQYGQNASINVTLKDADGNNITDVVVNVTINNVCYEIAIKNGVGLRNVTGLAAKDNYLVNATFNVTGKYNPANATDYFNVTKAPSNITVNVGNVTYNADVNVKVSVVNKTEVTYTVKFANGTVVYENVPAGELDFALKNLAAGNYTITVYNADADNYTGSNATAKFTVFKAPSTVNANNITFTVDESGNTTVSYEGASAVEAVIDGHADSVKVENNVITVSNLNVGNYTMVITTVPDANHTSTSIEVNVTVNPISDYEMTVNTTPVTPGENATVTVQVPENATGNVTVTLENGTNYTGEIKNGTATVNVPNLPSGDNNVTVTYPGDDKYSGKTAPATIHVKKVLIDANDMKRGWDSPYDYMAKLVYDDGTAIANKTITFVVNGKEYNVTTDGNGVAKLTDSKLAVGNYNVTVINPENGANVTKTTRIVKRLVENKDLTMDYKDGHKYVVRAIGDDGNPVGAGVVVQIKINGVTYKVKTDKNGYARFAINLIPKKYTSVSTYHKTTVKNKVTVKQILKVKKTVKVKKGKRVVLKATLKYTNGKALKNKKIVFKFKGKTYKAKTNSKGVAKITIKNKKVLKKLKKGKKYYYSAKYINDIVKGNVRIV